MDFEIIEDLTGLDIDALRKYESEALAAIRALVADDDAPKEQIERAKAIADSRKAALGQITDLEAADAARLDDLAALRAEAAGPEDEDEDEAEEVEEDTQPTEAAKEPALVASTPPARVPAARRAGLRQTKPEAAANEAKASIVAAADVPGVSIGSTLESFAALSKPTTAVLEALGRARGNTRIDKPIASFQAFRSDNLVQGASASSDQAILDQARRESRLSGGSLVAAGGWCAPSETIYDLCGSESLDGLWDVPTIQVNRGGVSFTKGPDFADFYASDFIAQTEAQAEAGATKDCVEIDCPAFSEVRLDVTGLCVTVPILTNAAFPELVQRYTEGLLVAHQHKKSVDLLNRALTIAGAATSVANPWPTASGSILAAIELVVLGERQRYRLGESETLEAVFPMWVKGAIRADLSIRTGVDLLEVTDEQIVRYFSLRGVSPQFVWGWQDLTVVTGGTTQVPATSYPATLQILLYPAGTFVAGTKDVITLNGVYDSVGLSTNVFTGLFTEEGISLMNMCRSPRRIQIAVPVTGLTADARINQAFGAVSPAIP